MGRRSRTPNQRTTPRADSRETRKKAFAEHIRELRSRITWVVLVFLAASSGAYVVRDTLIELILRPLGDQKLIYLTPAGGFTFIFQIAVYAGALAAAPLLIYHLYRFVAPALPAHARRHSVRVVVAATALMLGGVAFGYFVAVPAALHFLTTFADTHIVASLTADSYLNFVFGYVVGLGLMFELPLLLVFWNWISPLTPRGLLGTERFILVFAFVAAAIITPTPDVMNQVMIAAPILLVYQIGVVAVLIMNRQKHSVVRTALPLVESPPLVRPHPSLEEAIRALTTDRPANTSMAATVKPALRSPRPPVDTIRPVASPRQTIRSLDGVATRRPVKLTSPARQASLTPRPVAASPRLSLDGMQRY